jgi:hypothetical protein
MIGNMAATKGSPQIACPAEEVFDSMGLAYEGAFAGLETQLNSI